MAKYHKKGKEKEIAKERIVELFKQASLKFKSSKTLANRYVTLARKISMKFKVPIPRELKRRFCKHCYSYLLVGTNSRIRLNKGRKSYFCLECEKFTRIPYK